MQCTYILHKKVLSPSLIRGRAWKKNPKIIKVWPTSIPESRVVGSTLWIQFLNASLAFPEGSYNFPTFKNMSCSKALHISYNQIVKLTSVIYSIWIWFRCFSSFYHCKSFMKVISTLRKRHYTVQPQRWSCIYLAKTGNSE